ncbi:hypothetical protein CVT25_000803 [Psilocybe cyanescens]|uniref:Uncharacterized protein n=1 Tax=Psilocybe cyanescens TaxID=93625 RepID=A0A409W5F2_PSICY|nr:hypothetical protein CVT25_000803 [Psilocybe cyanescens]
MIAVTIATLHTIHVSIHLLHDPHQNGSTCPSDAISKQSRQIKEQVAAAKEAEKAANKKKEVKREKKLTNLAQADNNIILEMQAQEASEPHVCPRQPL